MRPTILLVEAHSSLLSNMQSHLVDAGFRIRCVDDGHAATRAVEEDRPAVVIVGRLSDHLSRFEFCESLRRAAQLVAMGIIVVLSRDSELLRIGCLEAGADDYIVEPFHENALLLRIQSLLRRSRPAEPAQHLRYAGLSIDVEKFKVYYEGKRVALRPKEFELLKVFLDHPETIMSRSEICEQAGWRSGHGSGRLVDSQVKLLRRALRERNLPDLIKTVRASGYMLSAEPPSEQAKPLAGG